MSKMMAINAGSSSLKWTLFEMPNEEVIANGIVERIGLADSIVKVKPTNQEKIEEILDINNHEEGLNYLLKRLKELNILVDINELTAVGHRIVSGGEAYHESVVITDEVLNKIEELSELAPLHNPPEAKVVRIFKKVLPNVINVAVFDTSFHQTLPDENYLYSIPYEYYEKYQARRYGAHGTSHKYVTLKYLEEKNYPTNSKIITCHLGNGASITAVKDGKSIDTSMGFTPLAGVTMGTRSGDIDPSLIAYLMEKENISDIDEFINILNKKSGLLGLSGLSSDMRDLRDARRKGNEKADLAIRIFCNRVAKYIGSYITTLNGCDAIIFTGGIGENSDEIRAEICEHLTWIGVDLDNNKNENILFGKEDTITTPESKIEVRVIPTNEELMIIRDTQSLI